MLLRRELLSACPGPMQSIDESGSFDFNRRVLLLAVDDNDECERALSWLLDNLYRCAAPADSV